MTLDQKIEKITQQTAGVLTVLERVPEPGDELLPPWSEATDWVARYDVRHVDEGGVVTVQARSINPDPATYPAPMTLTRGERWRYHIRKDGGTASRSSPPRGPVYTPPTHIIISM